MMPHPHGAVATSPADAEATKDIDPPGGATNPTVAGMVVHDPTMPSTATSMPSAAGIVMATDSNTTPSAAGTVGGGSPTPITDAIDQKSVDGAAATGGVHYIMTSTGAEVISSTMPPPDGAKATNTSTIGPFIGHVWFAQVKCNVLFPHLNYTIRLVCNNDERNVTVVPTDIDVPLLNFAVGKSCMQIKYDDGCMHFFIVFDR